jgi:hypothetical protein
MNHFLTYVKHSYEVILEAENKLCINLEHNTEAYMVHLFARYLDKPNINREPVCIKIMQGATLPPTQKKVMLQAAADECLLINGLELAKSRWPTNNYYKEMGILAYDQVAYTDNPRDDFYIHLAENFNLLSRVLSKCKINT